MQQCSKNMDIEQLIEKLSNKNLIRLVGTKRLTSQELPAILYIRMLIASFATKKSIGNCIATALETYCIRNHDKHMDEMKLQAAAKNISVEDYVAELIQSKING